MACALLFPQIVGTVLLLSAPPAAPQPGCDAWMQSVQQYDAQVDKILGGEEVEQVLGRLEQLRAADPEGRSGAADQLAQVVRSRLDALARVRPPEELSALHDKLMAYHRAVLESAQTKPQARSKSNAERKLPDQQDRKCFETLLSFFEELHDDLVEHGCSSGDAQALSDRMIPQLREVIRGMAAADD